ncbi:hypothetical protein TRFO_24101 [Tritrichomonas foetus]|uniref:Uncharacterized protein n=1 Tax=Tritrichomonas foetus TaxID=1144522 RepID=A0A1J4K8E6_9EUKA|nr:hypothetical protein TRFO_24101 [Tritrichomonas foetus]|eukprot:OHT07679.1 hypothetical protein TRFO_24101 [Tritrichomonas foetus]
MSLFLETGKCEGKGLNCLHLQAKYSNIFIKKLDASLDLFDQIISQTSGHKYCQFQTRNQISKMAQNPWQSNFAKTTTPFQTSTTSTGNTFGGNAFGTNSMTSNQAGLSLSPPPLDSVNDICINKKNFIATASWSGINAWKYDPPQQTSSIGSVSSAGTQPQITTLIDDLPIDIRNEPMIRCAFNTATNDILYFGSANGRILRLHIPVCKCESAGHHTDMVTGLKYCRERSTVVTSSPDGQCYIWDPRKSQTACIQLETGINCTNIDVVRNTVAICGIEKSKNTPIIKLFDYRSISNGTASQPLKSYEVPVEERNNFIQFSSVALNRDGNEFLASSLSGFLTISKGNNYKSTLICNKASKDNQSLAINSIALMSNVITMDTYRAHGCFIGRADGKISSLSTFRTCKQNEGLEQIKMLNGDFLKQTGDPLPVTACAVSPDAKFLVYASGDDYSKGYFQNGSQHLDVPTQVCIKPFSIDNDFKKLKI